MERAPSEPLSDLISARLLIGRPSFAAADPLGLGGRPHLRQPTQETLMLKFHPEPGTILICDYGKEPVEPEMVKRRPVIVISPKLKRRTGLCAVVPMSTTEPTSIQDYHCTIGIEPPLPPPFDSSEMWVKADLIATVGFHRLVLPRTGRDQYGKRKYLTVRISADQLNGVYRAVLCGLGMGHLTAHI